jgi:hypothetical protein
MDTPENPISSTPSPAQPETADLQAQVDSLHSLLTSVLVLVLILSGALNLYLWRQYQFSNADLRAARPQIEQMAAEWSKTSATMQDFIRRLADYNRTHADFAPIANKYHLTEMAAGMNKAMAAPAPKK